MGCSKNLVDSERLLFLFKEKGYSIHHDPGTTHGDIAVVNTCGFIGDAKEESINMILSLLEQKAEGLLEKVFVMGCLSERYLKELAEELPEVDGFYGKFDWNRLIEHLEGQKVPADARRILTTPPHYAYVKISEGCNRKCAYCAIPIITGAHKSRSMEEILEEVKQLVAQGVKEFQIIAQELTYYGIDLYKKQMLPQLIEQMAKIPGVEWIRLHYAYPTAFPKDLLRVMRENDNVCKYLDIALQHISTPMLERMQRHITKEQTLELIEEIRREVPGIHLRTTLMVGYPDESEEEFQELADFVKTARFERMGAFAYCKEEGTPAELLLEDNIDEEVKQARLDEIMRLQENISAEIAAEKTGQNLRVIIDREDGDYYIGRTEYDSPEVDGEVLIKKSEASLEIGRFYNIHITDTDEFDLYGKPASE